VVSQVNPTNPSCAAAAAGLPVGAFQAWSATEGAATTILTPANGATTVSFNGLGRIIANDDGTVSLAQVDVSSSTSGAEIRQLRITVATGGSVRKNPKGREIGFGRGIRLTEAGRKHPMYVGKLDVFNAPTVHLDEVETLAPGTTVLATNAVSDVQSAEIRTNGSVAWAVQYHPEYPLREVAAIVRRIGTRLIEEGFFADEIDIKTFAQDLDTLDRDPACKRLAWRHGVSKNVLEKRLRVSEVANWVEFQVLPTRVKRGRG
jgi:hypothetical protein